MVSLLDQLDRINKDNHGKIFHDQGKFFLCLLFLLIVCQGGRNSSYYQIWVNSWQRKWMNPFLTCEAGLKVGLHLRSRGNNHEWSTDINSPVPYSTRSLTGTWHQASVWNNKSCARNISQAHPWPIFHHPCDSSVLPPLIRALLVCSTKPQTDKTNGGRQRKYFGVKSSYIVV